MEIEKSVLKITKQDEPDTYFIPVYPRAYIEEIVGIDTDRRTVTAKFVFLLTVST